MWRSQTILTGLFKNASFGPPPTPHKRNSLMEVYGFGECLGWRFSAKSTFFSLISSRAFRDAPHSHFRWRDPNQCLPNFLNLLLLALSQIYTRVFHLWKTIDLDSAWVRDSRPYKLSLLSYILASLEMRHTRVLGARIPTTAYLTISTCYFYPCPKSTHVYFTCGKLSICAMFGREILAHINFLFSCKFSCV